MPLGLALIRSATYDLEINLLVELTQLGLHHLDHPFPTHDLSIGEPWFTGQQEVGDNLFLLNYENFA